MLNKLDDLRGTVANTEKDPREILREADAHKTRLLHGATIVSKESGELLDTAARHFFYNKPMSREMMTNLVEECGDILYGLQVVLDTIGSSFEEAIDANTLKLAKRYPVGYSNEACAERADKQEFEDKGIDWQLGREDGSSIYADTEQGRYLLEFRESGEAILYIDGRISRDFRGFDKQEVLARVRETYNETRRKAWEKEARK